MTDRETNTDEASDWEPPDPLQGIEESLGTELTAALQRLQTPDGRLVIRFSVPGSPSLIALLQLASRHVHQLSGYAKIARRLIDVIIETSDAAGEPLVADLLRLGEPLAAELLRLADVTAVAPKPLAGPASPTFAEARLLLCEAERRLAVVLNTVSAGIPIKPDNVELIRDTRERILTMLVSTRVCRVCDCTDLTCEGHWITDDLCSRCGPPPPAES